MQTDKGIVLATRLVEMLREGRILLPALNAVERVCAKAITRANRRIYKQLIDGLTEAHRGRLDQLLVRRQDSSMTWLGWRGSHHSGRTPGTCWSIFSGCRRGVLSTCRRA